MNEWKLENVKTEPWISAGMVERKFFAEMVGPRPFILIGYPKAWTPGTNGPVTADVVFAPITKEEDMQKYKASSRASW